MTVVADVALVRIFLPRCIVAESSCAFGWLVYVSSDGSGGMHAHEEETPTVCVNLMLPFSTQNYVERKIRSSQAGANIFDLWLCSLVTVRTFRNPLPASRRVATTR